MEEMIGKTFGLWTVIGHAGNDKRGRKQYRCRCSCGKERTVNGSNLRSGKSTSCGHTCREKLRVDLRGNRYGRLIALEPVEARRGNAVWRCRCDCGRECQAAANNLKNGHTTSCGCRLSEIQTREIAPRMIAKDASPRAGKFETNVHAADWILQRDGGTVWRVRNLALFVRRRPELFGLSAGDDAAAAAAARGLYDAGSRGGTWHGWEVARDNAERAFGRLRG